MSVLIKKPTIITQNKKREQISADIYIEDNEIVQISKKPISTEADYNIDGKKKVVLPGLINTHTHIPMTLLRGYGDDLSLNDWLENRIWPVESRLDKYSVEIGSKLGLLEMITTGTTTFVDMYFFEDVIGKSSEIAGVRSFLGFAFIDFGTPEYSSEKLIPNCKKFILNWRKNDLIKPIISPHSTYTCGPETLLKISEISDRYDVLMHTHCSETRDEIYNVQNKYGIRPVEQLKKYGLLKEKMILAHCGWVTKIEINDISLSGAKISHCPVSNMKIATGGYAPIPEFLESNVPVSLGTDGAASNNTLDMFETMKFCALLHKQHRWDPEILPAQTVLDMATIGGAKSLGMQNEIGSIEVGKKADIIMLDFDKAHLSPTYDIVSNLVYSAKGSDVCSSIVNGKLLMLENVFLTLDEYDIINKAKEYAKNLTR